ncbi:MAG TPA: hypothetical protein VG326_08650 [Tepidisphaeraceae bacterium]|jgi:hypothetical protein|nr:hypothetical protein [Tepidisphaeraceae bacterium]
MNRPFAIFMLATACLCGPALGFVHVKRDPPVVEHKTFDPANPPPEMPHLNPGEAAVTSSEFHIQAKSEYEVVSRNPGADGVTAVVSVHGITISTQLRVIVYVPVGAGEKLKAHEEGHLKLAEKIYDDYAIVAARAAAAQVDAHRFTGEGPDWQAAAQNAVAQPIRDMGQRYMDMTSKRSSDINDTYDLFTAHGANDKPVDVAMAEALAKYEKDHPTTRPAKRGNGH